MWEKSHIIIVHTLVEELVTVWEAKALDSKFIKSFNKMIWIEKMQKLTNIYNGYIEIFDNLNENIGLLVLKQFWVGFCDDEKITAYLIKIQWQKSSIHK